MPFVRIPASNVSELIERNKYTLIGRTDETTEAIGLALGPIETREVDKARFRVQVNGLRPLIMRMDIELPSKHVLEIELEYEHLEKHCFLCKALSHEVSDCVLRPPDRCSNGERRHTDISQQNTLESIEEGKQRHADRKFSLSQQANHQGGARWTNYRSNDLRNARSDDPRNARSEARENSYRYGSAKSSGFEENRRRYDERLIHNLGSSSLSRHPLPAMATHNQAATGQTAKHRDQSIPEVTRQQNSPSKEASSQSMHSPQRTISGSQRRGSLASRLSDPRTDHGTSEERKSAKEHLSVHTSRTSNAKQGESNTSGRLHDVEVQYLEEVVTPQVQPAAITRPSSLNVFDSGRLGSFERSPIRTLSEDRLHVSLRLGPLVSESESRDQEGE
ncbi:unnamed protein product, partial [Brassica oleracea var. botrytis]